MKKIIFLLLAVLLLFSAVSCDETVGLYHKVLSDKQSGTEYLRQIIACSSDGKSYYYVSTAGLKKLTSDSGINMVTELIGYEDLEDNINCACRLTDSSDEAFVVSSMNEGKLYYKINDGNVLELTGYSKVSVISESGYFISEDKLYKLSLSSGIVSALAVKDFDNNIVYFAESNGSVAVSDGTVLGIYRNSVFTPITGASYGASSDLRAYVYDGSKDYFLVAYNESSDYKFFYSATESKDLVNEPSRYSMNTASFVCKGVIYIKGYSGFNVFDTQANSMKSSAASGYAADIYDKDVSNFLKTGVNTFVASTIENGLFLLDFTNEGGSSVALGEF